MTDKVLLGYTVPEGKEFSVPIAHTVVTGMTQYGKTTTEEAIFNRLDPQYKILVFLTKRGEKVFHNARNIQPYYRERFDWEYVRGLLEAAWHEKMKFETSWIIRSCKGAKSLQEVRDHISRMLTDEKLRDFDRNIFTTLAAYMDKVLPTLKSARPFFSDTLNLLPGINVMDLTAWYTNEEVQMLVIRSCMEEILRTQSYVIVGLPETWKMLPQSRNTPVKLYFEKFVREGATNHCYLYIDAQDLGGVDKTPLRQVSVWIMGHMQEANEVERLLKQTLGVDVPAREIQTLPVGHFLVAAGETVTKVYVNPYGMPPELAQMVATGQRKLEDAQQIWQENLSYMDKKLAMIKEKENEAQALRELDRKQYAHALLGDLGSRVEALSRRVDGLAESLQTHVHDPSPTSQVEGEATLTQKTLKVTVQKAMIEFTLTTEKLGGKIMWMAKEGFLNTWKTQKEIEDELANRGWGTNRITVYKSLNMLASQGFIGSRKTDRMQFKLAPFVTFTEE